MVIQSLAAEKRRRLAAIKSRRSSSNIPQQTYIVRDAKTEQVIRVGTVGDKISDAKLQARAQEVARQTGGQITRVSEQEARARAAIPLALIQRREQLKKQEDILANQRAREQAFKLLAFEKAEGLKKILSEKEQNRFLASLTKTESAIRRKQIIDKFFRAQQLEREKNLKKEQSKLKKPTLPVSVEEQLQQQQTTTQEIKDYKKALKDKYNSEIIKGVSFDVRGFENIKRGFKGERLIETPFGLMVAQRNGKIRQLNNKEIKDVGDKKTISLNPINFATGFLGVSKSAADFLKSPNKAAILSAGALALASGDIDANMMARDMIKDPFKTTGEFVAFEAGWRGIKAATIKPIRVLKKYNNARLKRVQQAIKELEAAGVTIRQRNSLGNELRLLKEELKILKADLLDINRTINQANKTRIKTQTDTKKLQKNIKDTSKKLRSRNNKRKKTRTQRLSDKKKAELLKTFTKQQTPQRAIKQTNIRKDINKQIDSINKIFQKQKDGLIKIKAKDEAFLAKKRNTLFRVLKKIDDIIGLSVSKQAKQRGFNKVLKEYTISNDGRKVSILADKDLTSIKKRTKPVIKEPKRIKKEKELDLIIKELERQLKNIRENLQKLNIKPNISIKKLKSPILKTASSEVKFLLNLRDKLITETKKFKQFKRLGISQKNLDLQLKKSKTTIKKFKDQSRKVPGIVKKIDLDFLQKQAKNRKKVEKFRKLVDDFYLRTIQFKKEIIQGKKISKLTKEDIQKILTNKKSNELLKNNLKSIDKRINQNKKLILEIQESFKVLNLPKKELIEIFNTLGKLVNENKGLIIKKNRLIKLNKQAKKALDQKQLLLRKQKFEEKLKKPKKINITNTKVLDNSITKKINIGNNYVIEIELKNFNLGKKARLGNGAIIKPQIKIKVTRSGKTQIGKNIKTFNDNIRKALNKDPLINRYINNNKKLSRLDRKARKLDKTKKKFSIAQRKSFDTARKTLKAQIKAQERIFDRLLKRVLLRLGLFDMDIKTKQLTTQVLQDLLKKEISIINKLENIFDSPQFKPRKPSTPRKPKLRTPPKPPKKPPGIPPRTPPKPPKKPPRIPPRTPPKPPKKPPVPRLKFEFDSPKLRNRIAIYEAVFRERRNRSKPFNKRTNPVIKKTIKRTTTRNRMLNEVARLVDNRTVRSLEVKALKITERKLKDVQLSPLLKKFRTKKSRNTPVLKLVEKTKFISDSPGEKKELKLTRRLSKKRKPKTKAKKKSKKRRSKKR